ncbi:MAG: nitrate reductase associated protein [Cyanobacteria bacterium P01_F01_bin.150]
MTLFKFEDDFVQSLRCIPMKVRLKLDTCGVKLKLDHWNELSLDERSALLEMPCASTLDAKNYRIHLQELIVRYTGEPAKELDVNPNPPWLDSTFIPQAVQDKSQSLNISITQKQWAKLTPLQRFALIKLSRPSHENRNFLPAMQEFHLT